MGDAPLAGELAVLAWLLVLLATLVTLASFTGHGAGPFDARIARSPAWAHVLGVALVAAVAAVALRARARGGEAA